MTDLVERLRDRVNDCPMPAEHLMDEAADRIETLEAAILYAAETTNDCHTSRKLFNVLNPNNGNQPRVRMCPPPEELHWLVECPKYHPGEYFALCECGCGRHHWTKDVHKATKFPTKEAAENARGGDGYCVAVEHQFGMCLPGEE